MHEPLLRCEALFLGVDMYMQNGPVSRGFLSRLMGVVTAITVRFLLFIWPMDIGSCTLRDKYRVNIQVHPVSVRHALRVFHREKYMTFLLARLQCYGRNCMRYQFPHIQRRVAK